MFTLNEIFIINIVYYDFLKSKLVNSVSWIIVYDDKNWIPFSPFQMNLIFKYM